jgi:hypothetical protein
MAVEAVVADWLVVLIIGLCLVISIFAMARRFF